MTDPGSRRGAANLAPVLMILSFVAMVAFLVWLGATSEGTEGTVAMQEDTAQMDEEESGAAEVAPEELGANAAAFEGQRVRITADVSGRVGTQAFFLELPQSPFLVAMDSTLADQREGRMPSGEVMVTGMLHVMSDSVIGAWQEAGRISEGDVPVVEFATHFIEASRIRGGGDGDQQQDDDESGQNE